MRHVVYISDLNMGGSDSAEDAVTRSGYSNIAMELCRRMANFGYDVKVLGIGYTGQEYDEDFSVIPCANLQDVAGNLNNLTFMWRDEEREKGVDVVVCAMDIHYFQEQLFPLAKRLNLKYVCITPLESDPLCITWANTLREMDKVFFISQFGVDEAKKAGIESEHIEIGMDTKSWRLRTPEEHLKTRETLGFDPEDFVVLTVAMNQERKNLGRGLEIIAELKARKVPVKHILVTQEHSLVGWKLYDLAYELGVSSELRVFHAGMSFADLYVLYCAADAYLSCSKGEGLGLPIMEAMCVGVPVVAPRTGAIPELLSDNRGWIAECDYWYYDPFGNQRRYFISIHDAAQKLMTIKEEDRAKNARAYMETRTWDKPASQLTDAIEGILNV